MDSIRFDEQLVVIGQSFRSKEEVVHELASRLLGQGCVLPSYEEAVLRREASFPTGLPTEPICVAIPHADPEYCVHPALGLALLPEPVTFGLMGDEEATVEASVVFLLALKADKQLTFLTQLAALFQTPETLSALASITDPHEAAAFVKSKVDRQLAGGR